MPSKSELLTHLAYRGTVLQKLREGKSDSRDIAEELSKSRSSVDRDLRLLKDDGFIHEQVDGYSLTQFGEYALLLNRSADLLVGAKGLVPHLPSSAPFDLLLDAEIREAGGTRPQRPINHITDLIRSNQRVQLIFPVLISPLTKDLIERIQDKGISAEVIVTDDLLEQLWTTCRDDVHALLNSTGCSLRKTAKELSFVLVVTDDKMCLGVYDDSMRLVGTVTNGSDTAREWASEMFTEYKDASDEVSLRETTDY